MQGKQVPQHCTSSTHYRCHEKFIKHRSTGQRWGRDQGYEANPASLNRNHGYCISVAYENVKLPEFMKWAKHLTQS